jgi:NAD(P)-dependent dehydrogenase (short-subunit alcohol dehydrogenase family)
MVQARLIMKGKTVVITGGTSGIGEVAAQALAQMGARIVLVGRNKSRADATLVRLRRSGPGVAHSVYFADLTRLAEMKRVAAEIANREPPIDILINNAGALFGNRRLTKDGLEYTLALNHMSYFVVTEGLRERLLASGGARIINTASQRIRASLWISTIFNPRRASEPRGPMVAQSSATSYLRASLLGPAGHRRDRELSASWFRCNTLRR